MIWLVLVRLICNKVCFLPLPLLRCRQLLIYKVWDQIWGGRTQQIGLKVQWAKWTFKKWKSLWVESAYLSKYLNKPFGRKLWLVLCAKLAWYAADDWKQNIKRQSLNICFHMNSEHKKWLDIRLNLAIKKTFHRSSSRHLAKCAERDEKLVIGQKPLIL